MNKNKIWLILVGVLVLLGLFLLLKPKTTIAPSNIPTPSIESTASAQMENIKTFGLTIKDKKIVSGSETMSVTEGDEVVFKVTSDIPGEFHLHGYDKDLVLEKDQPGELKIIASLTGRFEIEFHDEEGIHTVIAALEVQPK